MRSIFTLLLLFCYTCLVAQSQHGPASKKDPGQLMEVVYELSSKVDVSSNISLPFSEIIVMDDRPDTTKIGFRLRKAYHDISADDFKKIRLAGGVGQSIGKFYNDYYSENLTRTADKLFIVLRKLWFSNTPGADIRRISDKDDNYSFVDVYMKIELYQENNGEYRPLRRIDTLFQLRPDMYGDKFLQLSKDLNFLVYSLKWIIEDQDFTKLKNAASKRRSLAWQTVDSFNKAKHIVPDFRTDTICVYHSINDFFNKKTVPGKFIYDRQRRLIDSADGSIIRQWAFTDSSGLHNISKDGPFLFPAGRTYEYFEGGQIVYFKSNDGRWLGLVSTIPRNVYSNIPPSVFADIPRQIDWETMRVY